MIDDLKPYPAYKDSGVEWLGDVPEHWEVRRLKSWLLTNQHTLSEDTDPDYTFDYVDISLVSMGQFVGSPQRLRFEDSPSRARRIVRLGDTIMSTVRTYLKAVWHAEKVGSDLIASTGFAVFTPKPSTYPKFVGYFCQSEHFTNRVTANSVGVAYPAIAETKLQEFEVSIPPLPELTTIARFLDKATVEMDAAISRTQRQIELFREYRTRLIADVVTGKLDVREAAASIPDQVKPPEPPETVSGP